jgi:hypothetical protein
MMSSSAVMPIRYIGVCPRRRRGATTSAHGTFETCGRKPEMSVLQDGPEVAGERRKPRLIQFGHRTL